MKESARKAKVWSDKVESSKRGAADKGYVGHKAAKMMKRSKNAEARKERAAEEKSINRVLKFLKILDEKSAETVVDVLR